MSVARRPGVTHWLDVLRPNRAVSPMTLRLVIGVQLAILLAIWFAGPLQVLPTPPQVFAALGNLWTKEGLAAELTSSFVLNLQALALTSLISIGLAYLTVLPFFRPIALGISKMRFLSMVGFTLVFTLMLGGGHTLKLALLVFGMTVFFVTSMASVVANIPLAKYEYARTLRMSEWRVVWEVVVLGTMDQAFEVMRQNAAMGWMMLTLVEGIMRSEGGIGAMLLNYQKHFQLPSVFALQFVILAVGLLQDYVLGLIRSIVCPYADLVIDKR